MKICSGNDFSQVVSSKYREIDSYINGLSDEEMDDYFKSINN